MRHPAALIACGLGLVAAVVVLLIGFGEPDDPYAAGGPDDADIGTIDDETGGALYGTATEEEEALTADTTPQGNESITGIVLDPDGEPVPGIEVTVRYSAPMWDDPDGYNAHYGVDGQLRRAKRSIDNPAEVKTDIRGRVTTDAEGKFEVTGLGSGSYQVRAYPEPPLLSLSASASISKTWKQTSVTVKLLRGSAIKGKVVDAADQPVAAVLTASWTDSKAGAYRSWTSDPVKSDEEKGAFAIPAVPDGNLRFTVTIPGKVRVTGLKAKAPTDDEVVLRLPGGAGVVSGTVTDQEEKAVRGALVVFTVEGSEGASSAKVQTMTDASGSYGFNSIPTGKLTNVQVLASGFAALSEAWSIAPWGGFIVKEENQTLNFKLLRGGTVKGRVLASGSDEGLADAQVLVFVASTAQGYTARAPLRTMTRDNGEFRVEGVPAGRLIVIATHASHYLKALYEGSSTQNFYRPGFVATSPPALTRLMPRNGATIEIDVTLEPGMPIEGVVIDPDGAPVPDAKVQVKNQNLAQKMQGWGVNWWTQLGDPVNTDDQGRFTFASLPPGKSFELYAKKEGFAAQYSDPVTLEAGQPAPSITLKLVAGATVRGTVLNQDGEGLSGANINIWGNNQPLAGGRTNATTDADGNWEVTGLAAGDYRYWVQLPGFNSITNQNQIKDLKEGEVREGIETTVKGGLSFSGKLVDSKGKPVPHQSLQLSVDGNSWYHANTNQEGEFTFNGVKEGKGRLHAQRNRGGNKPIGEPFQVPGEGMEFTYDKPPTHVIEGTIYDSEGNPVPLCNLEITGKGGGSNRNVYYPGMGNAQEVVYGVFRRSVTGAPPYQVTIKAARDAEGKSMNLAPYSKSLKELPKEPLEIRLAKGKEITGTVTDTSGAAIQGVTVRAGSTTSVTDATGQFRLGGLGESASLQFEVPEGYVKPTNRSAKAGQHVEVTVQPGLKIEGRAFDPQGAPLKSGWVNANWKKSGSSPAGHANGQVQGNGRFTLKGIPEGVLVTVTVNGAWVNGKQEHAPRTVKDIRPGTDDLEVHLGQSVTVEGKVLDSDGNPWTGGWVYAKSPSGQWVGGMQQIKKDGTFVMSGLSAGETYEIGVQRRNGGMAPTSEKVTAPATGVVLRMAKTVKIAGRIEGGETKGFRIQAKSTSGKGNTLYGTLKADGTFTIDNVNDGESYVLTATKRGDDRYARSDSITAGTTDATLRLQNGQSISGRVTVGGTPPDAKVWVLASGNGFSTWIQSDTDGSYSIKGLPPGSYKVSAMHPQTRSRTEPIDAEAGASGIDLDL